MTSRCCGEAHAAALALDRGTVGDNVMYFETGQGSALSRRALRHRRGVDQQTLEARAYAVARRFDPLLVNTVVGFIGPEYLYDGKQIIRAGLEDHFCGKLLGLPMGVDVCYTNHAEADQDDMDTLLTLLGVAGCGVRHRACPAPTTSCSLPVAVVPRRAATRARSSACARRRSSRRGWDGWGCSTMRAGSGSWRPAAAAVRALTAGAR